MLDAFRRKKKPSRKLAASLRGYELPSFPSTAMEVLDKLRDPNASTTSVGRTLSADPGLSVKVIATVNSAAYGLRNPVSSPEQAVKLLGKAAVESLVLSHAVRGALPSPTHGAFDSARFWLTASQRAALARSLAKRLHPASAAQCFTSALLQDMAVPLLLEVHSDRYGAVLDEWHKGHPCLANLEREAFGWDHAQLAGSLCDEWSFPTKIRTAIAGHHEASDNADVPLAVRLVSMLGESVDHPGFSQLSTELSGKHGIVPEEVEALIAEANEHAAELAVILR